MSNIIKQLEQEQLKQNVPSFRPGDTLEVKVWVVEGSKRRLQAFEGVVIAIRNRGLHSAFTLRKISNGVGVERVFQTHSPVVDSITVKRKGAVRKAKLYYLRERSGKSARIKERLGEEFRNEKGLGSQAFFVRLFNPFFDNPTAQTNFTKVKYGRLSWCDG